MLLSVIRSINECIGSQVTTIDTFDLYDPRLLLELSTDEDKLDTKMISGFILKDGENHFIAANCEYVSCLIIDIDKTISLKKAYKIIEKLGLASIVYTTHRHQDKIGEERFRVIFTFENSITIEDFKNATHALESSSLWKALQPDGSTLDIPRRFVLPPRWSVFRSFEGKHFPIKTFIKKGKKIKKDREFEQIRKNLQKSYDNKFEESDKKHFNYYQKIVERRASEFYEGNRDNWLNTTIFILKNKECGEDDIHTLLDVYIRQMSANEQNKFNRKIKGQQND